MTYKGKFIGFDENYKMRWNSIDIFLQCKRYLYMGVHHEMGRSWARTHNSDAAIDNLLKNEFDIYREKQEPHPYIKQVGKES